MGGPNRQHLLASLKELCIKVRVFVFNLFMYLPRTKLKQILQLNTKQLIFQCRPIEINFYRAVIHIFQFFRTMLRKRRQITFIQLLIESMGGHWVTFSVWWFFISAPPPPHFPRGRRGALPSTPYPARFSILITGRRTLHRKQYAGIPCIILPGYSYIIVHILTLN